MDRVVILSDGACASELARTLGRCLEVSLVGELDEADPGPAPSLVLLDAVEADAAEFRAWVERAEVRWPGVCVAALVAPAREPGEGTGAAGGDPLVVPEIRAGGEPALDGAFFRSVVDNLSSGILVADADGRIVFGNPYAQAWSGLGADDLRRTTVGEFCPGIAELAARGETAGETTCDFCKKRCSIGFRLFEFREPQGGRPAGTIVSFTDLSRVQELRRALRLKERLAAMGEVIARVAHEIRNPLFAISGAAQILAGELELSPKHGELMESVLVQARRLNRTVQDLLEFSQEVCLSPSWFELRAAVGEIVQLHAASFALRGASVAVDPGERVELFADRERVKQVITHLLHNAVEASPEGGQVTVGLAVHDGDAVLEVADRGAGVEERLREKVFQLYHTTKAEGRGLGLPLVRKIVEAHGGTVEGVARAGGGSVFRVRLPRGGQAA